MSILKNKTFSLEQGSGMPFHYGLAFFFIVLGIKFWIISGFGSSVPYWDQWDAEADHLYRPFLDGSLRLSDLFAPHNEHRILTTRVFGLGLLLLNKGVWDPMFEMYVNAVIHVSALLLLLVLMQKGLDDRLKLPFFAFASLFFGVPFGTENTLAGFQLQFYLLLLFSFSLLWFVYRFDGANWVRFILIAVLAFLSFFSVASGALSLAAAAGLLLVRWITGVDRKISSLILVGILLVAFAVAVAYTPVLPHHADLKAKNLGDFTIALWRASFGGVLYIPLIVFMVRQLINRPPANDQSWFIFSLGLWIFGQIFAISYGRAIGVLSSRYLDLFTIGILLNAYCLMLLYQQQYHMRIVKPALFLWMFIVVTTLGVITPRIMKDIAEKKAASQRYQDNVYGYLVAGDNTFLQKEPHTEIPYPHALRLKSLLDNPVIAGILTPAVNGHNSNRGLLFYTERSRKVMSVVGSIMFFYGIALFLFDTLRKAGAGYEKEV